MHMGSDNKTISTPAELAELTTRFIDQFCRQSAFPSTVRIQVNRHPQDMEPDTPQARPVHSILANQQLAVHLYEEPLMGISPLALQGWLDMELARRQLELEPALYRINFDKEIRPLLYLSGSGLHMIRHLVVHLETSLKNLIAARLVIEIGHCVALLYSYFYRITPSIVEKENYQRLVPYDWIRAIFLCKKNRGFAPVALLAEQGAAAELESYWWSCHAYMLPEDKRFLKTLFSLANQNPIQHFSETLVEMFKFVKSQRLIR